MYIEVEFSLQLSINFDKPLPVRFQRLQFSMPLFLIFFGECQLVLS